MNKDSIYRAIRLLLNPVRLYETFVFYTPWLGWSDKYFIKTAYHWRHRRRLNLENPRGFNEKIQWLKLYEWQDYYPVLVDKVRVKDWVAERIGPEYIIPTYGVWESAEDVDFDKLPEKFVIKCNHNSHKGLCICHDKSKLDKKRALKNLRAGLKQNYTTYSKEPAYGKVPRRILAEMLLEDPSGDVPDYKFFCYNGKVDIIMYCCNRHGEGGMHRAFFDRDWNETNIKDDFPTPSQPIEKPARLEEMVRIAETLSKDMRFIRVDLYLVEGKIYFGEMTLHSDGGFDRFKSEEMDIRMGKYLEIPANKDKCR